MKINWKLIWCLITWILTALIVGILFAILIDAAIHDAHAADNESDRDVIIESIGTNDGSGRGDRPVAPTEIRSPNESPAGNVLNFTAGLAAAYMIHESGHIVAGRLTHTDMRFHTFQHGQVMSFDMRPESDSDGLWVATAGLNAQLLCSEAILRSKSVDRHDPFVRGMMTWNVINPVLYSLDYWFLHKSNQTGENYTRGDIQCVEHYSDKRDADIFALSVSLLALYDGYRFLKPQNYNDKCRFYLSALPEGGVELGWRINF